MANGTILTSTIILIVINILASIYGTTLGVTNIGNIVVDNVFSNTNTANPSLNDNLNNGLQKDVTNAGSTTSFLSFVDGLKAVFAFIITLLTIGFALANMLIQTHAPIYFIYLIGLPTGAAFYIGIASFIRGFAG